MDKKTNEIKCGGNSWKKKTNSENDKKKTMTQYRKKIKIKKIKKNTKQIMTKQKKNDPKLRDKINRSTSWFLANLTWIIKLREKIWGGEKSQQPCKPSWFKQLASLYKLCLY